MKKGIIELFILNYSSLDLDMINNYLSSDEINYLNNYLDKEVKKEKIASLLLKKKYIGSYSKDKNNKPISSAFKFNISHSYGYIVLARNKEYNIGVDIELIREYKKELINRFFSLEEYNYIEDNKSFYEIWTSKESIAKAYGKGINLNMKNIPGLPINGGKVFNNLKWYSKTLMYQNYIISITINSKNDYDFIINELKIEDILS